MPGITEITKRVATTLRANADFADIAKNPKFSSLVSAAVKGQWDVIKEGILGKNEVFSLQGVGNLRRLPRKATKARNPKSGATFDVPAGWRVKLTQSKTLREELSKLTPPAAPTA